MHTLHISPFIDVLIFSKKGVRADVSSMKIWVIFYQRNWV